MQPSSPADLGAARQSAAKGQQGAVWLQRLRLQSFRCYGRSELALNPGQIVLTGPNGAGKTNILEAVSLLAPGRGLRRARLFELDRRGNGEEQAAEAWTVAAEIATPDGLRSVGTGRDPQRMPDAGNGGRERRILQIDGRPVSGQQALAEILALTWLTPQMDGLFREGASGRRRFLDRMIYSLDPAHAGRLSAYEQAMRERARLLRLGSRDTRWLAAYEDTMARHGVAVAAARRDMVARLDRACHLAQDPFPKAGLGLEGWLENQLDEAAALEVEDAFRAALAEQRGRDAESGTTGLGPHRSDLVVEFLPKSQPAALCSTGEQKALLIAIVLAHARLIALERGAAPVLLLDEVAAHLDASRRAALFSELAELGSQAWLTGTDRDVFAPLRGTAQFFRVDSGRLLQEC
jgi:DNA replication and repair protein RecF